VVANFPDSSHVAPSGLEGASGDDVWNCAATHGYTIVAKDDDSRSKSLVRGAPPKIIHLRNVSDRRHPLGSEGVCEVESATTPEAILRVPATCA
jgi:predicted nuclease of predicted toxin-antitoxin system